MRNTNIKGSDIWGGGSKTGQQAAREVGGKPEGLASSMSKAENNLLVTTNSTRRHYYL